MAAGAPPVWIEAVPLGVEMVMSPGVALIDTLPAAAWRSASPPLRPHAASASNAAPMIFVLCMIVLPFSRAAMMDRAPQSARRG
jgi:hypothetical protein